jgi:hypothetical protein
VLSITGSSLALIAGCFYNLNSAKGWIINPALSVGISIATIIIGALLLDLSTLQGILFFNVLLGASHFLTTGLFGWVQIRKTFSANK